MVLRSACALSHPRFGTDARFVEMLASQAQAIEKELLRLQAENVRLQGSLEAQRLISDRAIALAKELEASKNASIHKLEMDALDLASENSILKRQEQEELEARKPLPLSIERLDELWASQRSFHGGEPLKCGHVEFARLIEVEYGVLGRIPIREENGGQIDHTLIASREVVADGPVRVTRLNLTEEGRAALTSKATGPLPGITGGSS